MSDKNWLSTRLLCLLNLCFVHMLHIASVFCGPTDKSSVSKVLVADMHSLYISCVGVFPLRSVRCFHMSSNVKNAMSNTSSMIFSSLNKNQVGCLAKEGMNRLVLSGRGVKPNESVTYQVI